MGLAPVGLLLHLYLGLLALLKGEEVGSLTLLVAVLAMALADSLSVLLVLVGWLGLGRARDVINCIAGLSGFVRSGNDITFGGLAGSGYSGGCIMYWPWRGRRIWVSRRLRW